MVVVDEAILSLTGYSMANPVSLFYSQRPADVRDYHIRAQMQLADPVDLVPMAQSMEVEEAEEDGGFGSGAMPSPAPEESAKPAASRGRASKKKAKRKGGKSGSSGPAPVIAVRSNFNPLASFAPAVQTDSQGRARITVEMPDNLTRYRVMAVAVHEGTHFGHGESAVTARLPLMVRPSAPRFLNFGDSLITQS